MSVLLKFINYDSCLQLTVLYLARMSSRSFSIRHYFLRRRAAFFFLFVFLGGFEIGSFSEALEPGVLFLRVGKFREMILRSTLEVEAVVLSLLGLVLRDLDLEADLEYGLFKDFFD